MFQNFHLSLMLASAWLSSTALGDMPSVDTAAICSTLYSAYPDLVVWDPLGPAGLLTIGNLSAYFTANTAYWNLANSLNRAACTFFPSNAEQVSFAVKALNHHPSVKFAVKGAGHNPNIGYSSVDEGVLIAFSPNSKYAIPSADGSTIDLGAGAKWEDAYEALEPLGKAVVGGRLGDIGVVGFILGGGLSYLSAQYGLACDSVVNFEVVLADGTITNANTASNPDLFFSMRGGGNQFAIVTKMTLKTYDIGNGGTVWGGVRIYLADQHESILAAVANFTSNNKNPKAALIPTFDFISVGANIPVSIVFFFFDGETPPNGIFDSLESVPYVTSDLESRTYLNLTTGTLAGDGDIEGLRFQIRTHTFPNMPVATMSDFLSRSWSLLDDGTSAAAIADLVDVHIFSMAVQPLTTLITGASAAANGGNALGLTPDSGDRIWVEYDLAWASPLCDEICPGFVKQLADQMHDIHVQDYSGIFPTNYQSGNLTYISYNPIFMNDAMYDQQVLQSYGAENYQRLKATQAKYDPEGFFTDRTGGFKFTT